MTFVIINPVAGSARQGTADERVRLAAAALTAVGMRAEIVLTAAEGHAFELANAAVAQGAELVIAWGGDGTINEVGRALAFTETALGIVPAGSGNGFARELGIPFSPHRALAHALATPPRSIDSAEIEGRLCFNVAGIGLDAHVAERVSRKHHAHGGLWPYIMASAREIRSYTAHEYTIQVDDDVIHRAALLVAVANSRQYGYGAKIAPTARLDDGELELVMIEDRGLVGNLIRLPFLMTGGLHRQPGVTVRRVREVAVTASGPIHFHVDGEALTGGEKISARVRPGSLRVRA
jgi:YegS/Rv2252/BmrU family lipid kinase